MSVGLASVRQVIERWSRDQVLALAPDASSQKAAQGVAAPGKWISCGTTDDVLFGECKGSGAKPYQACVDLSEPAYRCGCPSRKFPCKHALGLLLLWSADGVPVTDSLPPWVAEWIDQRADRAAKSAAKIEAARARAAAALDDDSALDDAWDSDGEGESEPHEGSDSAPDSSSGSVPDSGSGATLSGEPVDGTEGRPGAVSDGAPAARSGGAPYGEPRRRTPPGTGSGGGSGGESYAGPGGAPDAGPRRRASPGGESYASSGSEPGVAADGGRRAGASGVRGGGNGRGAGAESVRHARVTAGLTELERWLADQVRQGLAAADPNEWDDLAKRLVDAQAPGVANAVSRLREARMSDDWPSRLLEEYSLINLLAVAYRRRAELPGPLRETVLIRAGFPVTREEVLVGPVVRDRWHVVGRRDEEHDRLTARRVWLRGHDTGRAALVLSFAATGQALDASLVTGAVIDADVCFYPGAAPLRALVSTRHRPTTADAPTEQQTPVEQQTPTEQRTAVEQQTPTESSVPTEPSVPTQPSARGESGVRAGQQSPADESGSGSRSDSAALGQSAALSRSVGLEQPGVPGQSVVAGRSGGGSVGRVPPGVSPEDALDEVAAAVAADPWTDSWPVVLADVVPGRESLGGLPLHPKARDPWRLIAVSGGRPVTVAAEWTPIGLRPLTTWDDDGTTVIL
jgi:hypothetical protein